MPSHPAGLQHLIDEKRREWTAALLARQPRLRQSLIKALELLQKGCVAKDSKSSAYRVRSNPHDYRVNVARQSCSCGTPSCEHFLAAWFAFSEEEIVRERMVTLQTHAPYRRDNHREHGRWQGPNVHICDDGYRETMVYGTGEHTECARCRTLYCAECDETR